MSYKEDNILYNKTLEQNISFLNEINPKFKDAAKYIITKYDWKNSPLDFPQEYINDIDKILEFSKIYIEKREKFFKLISLYLK